MKSIREFLEEVPAEVAADYREELEKHRQVLAASPHIREVAAEYGLDAEKHTRAVSRIYDAEIEVRTISIVLRKALEDLAIIDLGCGSEGYTLVGEFEKEFLEFHRAYEPWFCRIAARMGVGKVIGVDIDGPPSDILAGTAGWTFQKADILDRNFQQSLAQCKNQFDVVYSQLLFGHTNPHLDCPHFRSSLGNDQTLISSKTRELINLACKIIKPEGIVFISTDNQFFDKSGNRLTLVNQ